MYGHSSRVLIVHEEHLGDVLTKMENVQKMEIIALGKLTRNPKFCSANFYLHFPSTQNREAFTSDERNGCH